MTFKNFSATSASNGGLIEWQIALSQLKRFFSKSMYTLIEAMDKCLFLTFQVNLLRQK